MKLLLCSCLMLITNLALSIENDSPLKEAVISSLDGLSSVNDLNHQSPDSCSSKNHDCHVDGFPIPIKKYKTILLSYDELSSLPPELKKILPGHLLEGDTKGGVKVIISLPNDNKLLGLWGIIFGKDGDDFGQTHGMGLNISTTLNSGHTLRLQGSSDLYTKPERIWFKNKEAQIDMKFTNEYFLKLIADNIHANKAEYWKLGVGWQALDSKNSSTILTPTGQQASFHNYLQNTISPSIVYDPVFIPDGKPIRHGLMVEAFYGLQKNFVISPGLCRLKINTEIGGRVSTLNSSFAKLSAGTHLYLQKQNSKFSYMIGSGYSMMYSAYGPGGSIDPSIGMNHGRLQYSLVYNQNLGKLQNHMDYNSTNVYSKKIDPILTVNIGFVIGRFKSK